MAWAMARKRLLAKTAIREGCWLWTGCIVGGYGLMRFLEKTWKAHRVAYKLFVGEIPEGMCVLHKCDVPSCVKPSHLFLGTHKDNAMDRERKGRGNGGMKVGVVQKLKPSDVRMIRYRYATGMTSQYRLAKEYGIKRGAISHIVTRNNWKNVQ